MERINTDEWKNKSKNIRIGYVIIVGFLGVQIFLQLIGYRKIDYSILDLFYYFDTASIGGAIGYLFPYVVLGAVSWYLGRREFNKGNIDGKKLMKHSIVTTGFLLLTILVRGFYGM